MLATAVRIVNGLSWMTDYGSLAFTLVIESLLPLGSLSLANRHFWFGAVGLLLIWLACLIYEAYNAHHHNPMIFNMFGEGVILD
jgi:hypothetical protein